MTITDVIDWVAENGADHVEFAMLSQEADSPIPNLTWDPSRVAEVKDHAASRGITLSNLAVGADLTGPDRAEVIDRVKAQVDLAASLGMTRLRHDVTGQQRHDGDDSAEFDRVLPLIAEAAKEIARHAATVGVTTSLENHGYFVQASERVRRVVRAVDEPNFGTTLDVGNFACVDEDSVVGVAANLPYATVIHFKDFYLRPAPVGTGWFASRAGRGLRGAIAGNGDLDLSAIATLIRESDYDGFVAIEFEGAEDCLMGCEIGMENVRRLLADQPA
ncbi:sugar phosphate isomerase/epimerase family protein [Propionibacteriaceae bacterium Y2011]